MLGEDASAVVAGLQNNLRKLRLEAGLSQQALAKRANVSRQAYGALEAGTANPSTELALRLARVLGGGVESIFFLPPDSPGPVEAELAGGALPPGPGLEAPRRARLYRVGPRLFARTLTGPGNARQSVIPAEGTVIDAAATGNSVLVQPFDDDDVDTPSLGMLGCDPAVGLLEPELRRRGVRLVAAEESSREALLGLARGEAHVAGCHLRDDATGSFNRTWVERLVPFPCTLVTFASWEQGLMVAPGNPKGIRGIESLANPGVAMVNRQSGSGSRALLDRALLSYGVPVETIAGYQREEYGHLAVAAAVAYGGADVGVGVKAAALATGLDFIRLEAERYDLVVPDHLLNDPAVQALLDILRRDEVHRRVESLGGYDASEMGLPAAA